MKGSRAAQNGGDPSAQIGRQLILEPWVAPLPNCTAPRGVRERDHCGPIGAPCRDGLGHRTPRCVRQRPPLSISADQQRQFHPRQACQERLSPERGAPGWWRIIAAFGIGPRKAECHGGHTNTCVRRSSPSHSRRRSPDGSSNGSPLSCTRRPGAWPQINSRISEVTCTTGRGSWPNSSTHARHARMLESNASSCDCSNRGDVPWSRESATKL